MPDLTYWEKCNHLSNPKKISQSFFSLRKTTIGHCCKYARGLFSISTCYYRAINVLQGTATVYQLEGLEAPMEPIPLRRIKHTEATGSGGRSWGGRGVGVTDQGSGINQYPACSDKSCQLRWPTGPHTLAHKTILVPDVKTAKSYHCHGSAAGWCVSWKSA